MDRWPDRFATCLEGYGLAPLRRRSVTTLQANLGMRCNMACLHCHVEAGPERTEEMTREIAERVVTLIETHASVSLLDLTGGAPELNPHFRWMVTSVRALGRRVIDRCNLTVLFEPGQEDLAEFLADNQVEVVASLPCYSPTNLEKQRGRGAFDKSIEALQQLNKLGYGRPDSPLRLSLVYNPVGPTLPPAQASLEATYKAQLSAHFGIEFHELFTITNMPIKRFDHALRRDGKLEDYLGLLEHNFNPAAADAVMCRSLLSIGYDGTVYDCDFNQMLELPLGARRMTVWDLDDLNRLDGAPITTDTHCLGCTAGAGSSCGGALA
ncbi:MAG: arsenosugar biosynthesis radical SAM (seleno)protein ArsS [Kofleriaceae bacterium]